MVRAELTWRVAAALWLVAACGPRVEEGALREVRKEGRAGVVTLEGQEVYSRGKWRKTGPFVFRSERGEVIAEGHFVDGLEDGLWTQTVEDGSRGVGRMREGAREGEWKWYHPGGELQDVGVYERGLRVGLWRSYRADGTLLREAEYADGEVRGGATYYREDGMTVDRSRRER